MTNKTKAEKRNRWTGILLSLMLVILLCFPAGAIDKTLGQVQAETNVDTVSDTGDNSRKPDLVMEISDYRDLSRIISGEDEKDCFGRMTVDAEGQVTKDGENVSLEEEFDATGKEAEKAADSKKALENFLQEKDEDTIYQVEKEENGNLEVTAPYQTRRLIIDTVIKNDTLGASRVYYNTQDHETILEYDTEEETKAACEEAVRKYGSDHCFVDEIVYFEDIMQAAEGTPLPAPAKALSWGTRYMKTNSLKTQAAYYGYNKKVTVAVIDSGVNKAHPLFSGGRILSDSWNFYGGDSRVVDYVGHGSHVAGIIADGTPSNVKILALKVTDFRGRATLYSIKTAIRYAIKKKVQVINLSLGQSGKNAVREKYLDDIIKKAYYKGIPICAAAGNSGVNVKYTYPANTRLPITVGAINSDGSRGNYTAKNGKKVFYSDYGSTVDFAAPGTNIISAGPGYYDYVMTGTSMAAPHISAAIAYIKMMQPDISVKDVEKQLRSMSKDLGPKGRDKYYGWGCPIMDSLFVNGLRYQGTTKDAIGKTQVTGLKNKEKGIQISWKNVKKADKYKIYRRTASGDYKKIATVSAGRTSYVDQKAKQGRKYFYKVRIFCGGVGGYGSEEKPMVRLKPVSGIKAKKTGKGNVVLSWKNSKKVSRYQIEYSGNSSMKKKDTMAVMTNRAVISGVMSKYCYYRIRTIKTVDGATYRSPWSKKNKLKIR